MLYMLKSYSIILLTILASIAFLKSSKSKFGQALKFSFISASLMAVIIYLTNI